MRDLTLLDTGCLAVLLVGSLVLPLLLGGRASRQSPVDRSGLWIVGWGQALLSLAGIAVLVSPVAAPVATVLGIFGMASCAVVLRGRQRSAGAGRES